MYDFLNEERWDDCFALIDPKLRGASRVDQPTYIGGLRTFRAAYGKISPWYIRISLHLDGATNKRDPRPFAYIYAVWQDEAERFHMFRERWVKESGRWFTRVLGLVPNMPESVRDQH